MDLLQSLQHLANDNLTFFTPTSGTTGAAAATARRFAAAFAAILRHGRHLGPAMSHLAQVAPKFDLDESTPGNGYRSLMEVVQICVDRAVQRCRHVAAHRKSLFFRAGANAAEIEAVAAALGQLRALLVLAAKMAAAAKGGRLFPDGEDNEEEEEEEEGEEGISAVVLREYSTMHNGCFYGRCLGFQFVPSLRPFLQTLAIGLVSFGENYRNRDPGIGVAAGSLFTSGKFALDPELRGAEFERLTQNLDVHFWKSFWNLTETELLASVASLTAVQVGLCRALAVPPEPLELPLARDPSRSVTVAPPGAHLGPAPLHLRLLSYHLRQGQDSAALSALSRQDGGPWTPSPFSWRRGPPLPPSPGLLVHFHGGGFVAQTSRSHEPYLRGWARDLGTPILSVDYALAPEAPFPRALEECFYAYCWALRHCRMLGSTAERVCLAGDSAGGNLCLGVSLRAVALGVRVPQAVLAAYPVTLVQAAASPSRLLTLLDPLLPLGVLCQCLGAYAGTLGEGSRSPPPPGPPVGEGLILRGLRGGAAWLGGLLRGRPPPKTESSPNSDGESSEDPPEDSLEDPPKFLGYPEGFRPLRTGGPPAIFGKIPPKPPRDPFMSPLLAPDSLLGGLPPIHLVACALDPMLDDSVALARRLRALGRPVTLRVVPGVPHGFLSLAPLSPECRRAGGLCPQKFPKKLPKIAQNPPNSPQNRLHSLKPPKNRF
uniref:Hormone-sensitive lipase n=1 Tax=Taeniopygia guttata TaxID=59729 RepID=A0AAT9S750_TAEGU